MGTLHNQIKAKKVGMDGEASGFEVSYGSWQKIRLEQSKFNAGNQFSGVSDQRDLHAKRVRPRRSLSKKENPRNERDIFIAGQ